MVFKVVVAEPEQLRHRLLLGSYSTRAIKMCSLNKGISYIGSMLQRADYPTCACFMSASAAADCWCSESSTSILLGE